MTETRERPERFPKSGEKIVSRGRDPNHSVYLPPTPSGRPSHQYASNNSLQPTRNDSEYGSISDTSVPIPVFLTYRWQYTTISGKYAISGVIGSVTESPMR